MDMEPIFKGNDLRLIESLVYDPSLKPRFDFMRDCLVWPDEAPNGLTPAAYSNLMSLWIARSFLHRNLDFSEHPLNPDFIKQFWHRALSQGFKWPGFNRLMLNEADKAYYEDELKKSSEMTEY